MSTQQTVLYDAPGPRARRITMIGSIVAGLAVLAFFYFFVIVPLNEKNQFSIELWGPLVDPSHPEFSPVWKRLGEGFRATLTAAAIAVVTSLVVGTGLAVLRVQLKALVRRRYAHLNTVGAYALRGLSWLLSAVTRVFVEVFRGLPVVTTVFFVWVMLPTLGINLGAALWYLVIGLTLYNSVVIGEILRSGMEGLPGGQREAAEATGLSTFQTIRIVLLPQSFRIMLPALIGQLVVVLKDTSLGFIIGYEEVLRVASQIIQAVERPNMIQTYLVVGAIYILINWLLSRLAQYAERRVSRGSKAVRIQPGAKPPVPVGTGVESGAGGAI